MSRHVGYRDTIDNIKGQIQKIADEPLFKSGDSMLKTAVRLFSRHGYNGASVDKIVHAASVNKRMVYHYFGNKENLKQDTLLKLFFDSARRLFHSANP